VNVLTQIMIVDPSILFREGLRRILTEAGFNTIWCSDLAPSAPIAGLADEISPLLIVGSEIAEASAQVSSVKRIYPYSKAIIIADAVTQHEFISALRYGAQTLILKHSSCDALIATLRLVADGVAAFPKGLIEALILETAGNQVRVSAPRHIDQAALAVAPVQLEPRANLSNRESEVLNQLLLGRTNKEIARALVITEATVKVHVKAIFRKARVRSRTQVVIWASRHIAAHEAVLLAD